MMILSELSKTIKTSQKQKRPLQEELSKMCGVSSTTVIWLNEFSSNNEAKKLIESWMEEDYNRFYMFIVCLDINPQLSFKKHIIKNILKKQHELYNFRSKNILSKRIQ